MFVSLNFTIPGPWSLRSLGRHDPVGLLGRGGDGLSPGPPGSHRPPFPHIPTALPILPLQSPSRAHLGPGSKAALLCAIGNTARFLKTGMESYNTWFTVLNRARLWPLGRVALCRHHLCLVRCVSISPEEPLPPRSGPIPPSPAGRCAHRSPAGRGMPLPSLGVLRLIHVHSAV